MTNPHTTHIKPTPSIVCTRLRKHHPDIYKSLTSDYKPLQHDFNLIDKLHSATDDRTLFFAAILLLFGKYADPLTMPHHHLHKGVNSYLTDVTGIFLPNITIEIGIAQTYFKVPGFREQVEAFIYEVTGITV